MKLISFNHYLFKFGENNNGQNLYFKNYFTGDNDREYYGNSLIYAILSCYLSSSKLLQIQIINIT